MWIRCARVFDMKASLSPRHDYARHEQMAAETGSMEERMAHWRRAWRLAWPSRSVRRRLTRWRAQGYTELARQARALPRQVDFGAWAHALGGGELRRLRAGERRLRQLLRREKNMPRMLRIAMAAGLEIELADRGIMIRFRLERPLFLGVPQLRRLKRAVVLQSSSGQTEWRECGWEIAGATHDGGKRRNDDAIGLARYHTGELLCVVADGIGDTLDGQTASRLAVRKVIEGMKIFRGLSDAVAYAAAAIRGRNRRLNRDGGCTMAVVMIDDRVGHWDNYGDTMIGWQTPTQEAVIQSEPKSHRTVLGGEPVCRGITSSGNSLNYLIEARSPARRIHPGAMAVLLASDGILLGSPAADRQAVQEVLANKSAPAREGARQLVALARRAFARGGKRDNVSCVFLRRVVE